MRFLRHLPSSLSLALALSAATTARAAVDYARDIKPLLSARCYACHGVLKQKGGLRLDTAAALRRGGKNPPAIVAGQPATSLVVKKIAAQDPADRMPPEGDPLTPAQIAAITTWIAEGAVAPADELPPVDPRQHWSYQPAKRPAVPVSKVAGPPANPIDSFLASAREVRGLHAAAPASKDVLLRRVYLDLIGLPPTREELHAFLADATPDAYEKVVDRLLASPRYGERWGRHWMDIWRYSDWYGYRPSGEIRYSQRHIWRWRDWIVESLNGDKGYDRMLTEMLAGDEVAPTDPGVLRATGYLGRNWYKFDRNVWLFETVEQTAQGMLGMTLRCARCHDHKFDPLTQLDYYQFRAFFEPHGVRTDLLSAEPGTNASNTEAQAMKEGLARVYDATNDAPTFLFLRGDDRQPDKAAPLKPAAPAVFGDIPLAVQPVALPADGFYPALRPALVQSMLENAAKAVQSAQTARQQAQDAVTVAKSKREAFVARQSNATIGPKIFFEDDFATAKPALWQTISGEWAHEKGGLAQKAVGTFHTLVSQTNHLRDFCARVTYRTLELGNFRSVGVFFDSAELRDAQAVYTSISNGASSVQAFHRENAQEAYPAAGIAQHPLKLNEPITLDIAARGAQLNVWVNGKLALAYTMPRPRRDGRFALWVHSGAAVFSEVRLAALPEGFVLAENMTTARLSPFVGQTAKDFDVAVDAAEKLAALAVSKFEISQAEQAAVQLRVAADRAQLAGAADFDTHARAAAKAERQLALAKAKVAVLETTDEKKLATARQAVTTAETNLAKTDAQYTPLGTMYPKQSTGRRLALARWMSDPRNPRTARVAVNHIWLRHFGAALVPTVANFGVAGQPPSHPELLDWLAVELMESGWRMKSLHRLMVSSQAYRMVSATDTGDNAARDPGNRFLWRMNPRRMEAEAVRDGVLAAGGSLDLTMGGADLEEGLGQTTPRRSLYFRTTPDNKMAMLELFDLANPSECYQRRQSVMPQQALVLMNSALALDQSRLLARKLAAAAPMDEAFVVAAFESVLSRAPSKEELAASVRFLQTQAAELAKPAGAVFATGPTPQVPPSAQPAARARENLVHVLFNHHDFVTIR